MKPNDTIFQTPLSQLHLTRDGVPVFLPSVAAFLRQKVTTVGIFRLCGNHTTVQDLGKLFALPECSLLPHASVHDITSFLKKWLRELPEPLVSPLLFNLVYDSKNPSTLIPLLNSLLIPARKSLALISGVVDLVLQNQAVNQMTPLNMVTCFAGSFMHDCQGLDRPVNFCDFIRGCAQYLNEEKNDFVLPKVAKKIQSEEESASMNS
jgi:hypothetical protein